VNNKPKSEVHPGSKLRGPKEEEKKNSGLLQNKLKTAVHSGIKITWHKEKKEEIWSIAQ
jgi:hypothetical protein